MLTLPSFAKINFCLRVLERRGDGFHEVRTVLQSVDLSDQLSFEPIRQARIDFQDPLGLPDGENLVIRAARMLQSQGRITGGVRIVLRKELPIGAGLGGGSGNAAVTLLGLNQVWGLRWPLRRLEILAKALGSDVPFFLFGGSALAVGRGDEVYPLADMPETHLVVVCPPQTISTRKAYQRLNLMLTKGCNEYRIQRFCEELGSGRVASEWIFNDFEESVFRRFPEAREARDALLAAGCPAALMCGSGSSVFGLAGSRAGALRVRDRLSDLAWPTFVASSLSRSAYRERLAECGLERNVDKELGVRG